jgi:transcriptional regulator with XRE-family HTH domain
MAAKLTFVEATNRLTDIGLSLGAVADRFGVRRETISRWRRESGSFPPPENWRDVLAQLAEERGKDLNELVRELRGGAV